MSGTVPTPGLHQPRALCSIDAGTMTPCRTCVVSPLVRATAITRSLESGHDAGNFCDAIRYTMFRQQATRRLFVAQSYCRGASCLSSTLMVLNQTSSAIHFLLGSHFWPIACSSAQSLRSHCYGGLVTSACGMCDHCIPGSRYLTWRVQYSQRCPSGPRHTQYCWWIATMTAKSHRMRNGVACEAATCEIAVGC
jgi:hypothetical protein